MNFLFSIVLIIVMGLFAVLCLGFVGQIFAPYCPDGRRAIVAWNIGYICVPYTIWKGSYV